MSDHARRAASHYTQAEGDEIARMVLQLVKGIRDGVRPERPIALDRNGPNPTYLELERLVRPAP